MINGNGDQMMMMVMMVEISPFLLMLPEEGMVLFCGREVVPSKGMRLD